MFDFSNMTNKVGRKEYITVSITIYQTFLYSILVDVEIFKSTHK